MTSRSRKICVDTVVDVWVDVGDFTTDELIEELAARLGSSAKFTPRELERIQRAMEAMGFEVTRPEPYELSTAARFRGPDDYAAWVSAERAAGRIALHGEPEGVSA